LSDKRVIVIGSEGHSGVETASWAAEKMPNISDFDAVVIDTSSLASLIQEADSDLLVEEREKVLCRIDSNLDFIQERLLHTLYSKGDIYVICSSEVGVRIGVYSIIGNYSWSPIPIKTEEEQGKTIHVIDELFEKYFQFVKGWSFCLKTTENVDMIDEFYENKYAVQLKADVIAENRYQKPLGLIVQYTLHRYRAEKGRNVKVLVHISGRMVLLPPPTEIENKEAISIIIEEFFGIHQLTPLPEWVAQLYVPGEFELEQLISSKREAMDKLQADIGDLDKSKSEKSQFKQLLYETGSPLENICRLTIRKLGAETNDSTEDFVLRSGDREAVVEVKGREAIIQRKDGDQLVRNLRSYAMQKNVELSEVKGILLGNPWRLLPLEERGDKEAFAPHLISDAKRDNIALVTTVDLFRAYSAVLNGSISKEDVIERLFSGVGVTDLSGKD